MDIFYDLNLNFSMEIYINTLLHY